MISFIIPAHNEQGLIARTIRSLQAAIRPRSEPSEIIVVDDASTDRTAAIARELGAQVVPVQLRQIAAVRNAGARQARGDVLIFVDADTVVPGSTLNAALRALARGAAGGGAGIHFDGRLPWHAVFLTEFMVAGFYLLRLSGGCFIFCTRRAFDGVGGWDEQLFASEEITLCQALKRQGRFVVLRERVITSGRKLRAHSFTEIVGTLGRIAWRGRAGVGRRDGLELWYGERRVDAEEAEIGTLDSAAALRTGPAPGP
jgi:cellulose synthase/poly-beta-1,6-N-acetylglucosamine synthase-like glycosyltransferase